MARRISVVISQSQSQNPQKRNLEEEIVTKLLFEPGIDATIIPHLYDLKGDGTGALALQGIKGDLILCSWLYERAALWVLDRHQVRGKHGTVLLQAEVEDDEEEEEEFEEAKSKPRVIDAREIPNRRIYCLDLRVSSNADDFVREIKRIAKELATPVVSLGGWVQGKPTEQQMERFQNPTNTTHDPAKLVAEVAPAEVAGAGVAGEEVAIPSIEAFDSSKVVRIEEQPERRWYPVIDYSRCTNCMECIDFCLFGVYGIDRAETILVEQPDNCRKGCPACSRVCPENAIIFPQHKTPAIAGSNDAAANMKIDLSKLFGAPDSGKSAIDIAILERDEQLLRAGREIVGDTVGISKAKENEVKSEEKDELDALIDQLDELNL